MSSTTQTTAIETTVYEALENFGANADEISRDATWEKIDVDSLDLTEFAQIVEDDQRGACRRAVQQLRLRRPQRDALSGGPLNTQTLDPRETEKLSSGDDAVTNDELAAMAANAFGREPPRSAGPGEDPRSEQRAGAFVPYFRSRLLFDARRGRKLGFRPPPLKQYFGALMDYADRARWGKKPMPRWAVAAE